MTYLLCDHWGGVPHDAKKTVSNTEDDSMCWAAAASNILAWTKWGFPEGQAFNDAASIFKHFQDHWRDSADEPNDAWKWWFTGKDQDFPNVDAPGGGGFWKSAEYSFEEYYHVQYDRRKALSAIADFLHQGYGVALQLIAQQSGGHTITCWGYEQNDEGRYLGIYTTDSDDSNRGLRYYEINQDTSLGEWAQYKDWWYFTYYDNSTRFLLGTVYALDRCPKTNPAPPVLSPPSNLIVR